MQKNSKIYVAGHNGMVGSALTRALIDSGYTNLIFSPFPPYDLTDQRVVAEFFDREKPEYVFLAAAKVGGITANNKYRAQFIYENLMIQNNILHQSYLHKVKKLLFLGSSCIYPKNCPQPIKEEYLLTGELEYTNEPYAIAKIAGLKMCEAYNIQYGTDFISVMPTNLYGLNDNFNLETSHVLPALLRKIYLGKCLEGNDFDSLRCDLNRRPINGIDGKCDLKKILSVLSGFGIKTETDDADISGISDLAGKLKKVTVEIWGTGRPMREFMWAGDLADACIFLMNNISFKDLAGGNEIRNTHLNIGTGKDLSIKDLAILIKEIAGFKGDLVFNAGKPDGTMRKLISVEKINKLGWSHKTELEDGIVRLFSWYINDFNAKKAD